MNTAAIFLPIRRRIRKNKTKKNTAAVRPSYETLHTSDHVTLD